MQITFRLNSHATDSVWELECTGDLAGSENWSNCAYSVQSQSNIGDRVEYVIQPAAPLPDSAFYRIKAMKN